MKVSQLYIIFLLSLFNLKIEAQYVFPKLPVESKELKIESDKIIQAGYKLKQDIRYEIYDGKVTSNKYSEKETEFNEKGKIKEVVIKDKTGRTKVILIYLYDSNGFPKRITKFHPTGDILGRFEFKYDTKGFLFERAEYDQYDFIVQKIIYQRNISENTITERYYNSPEMVTKTLVWKYSDLFSGRLLSVSEFEGESTLKIRKDLIYEGDKLMKEHFINRDGNIIYYHSYTYDTSGNISEIKKDLPMGTSYNHLTSQYNSKGLISGEIKYGQKGNMKTYYKFIYQ